VKRGLVETPEDWRQSSSRFYAFDEAGLVRVNLEGSAACRFVHGRGTLPMTGPRGVAVMARVTEKLLW